MTATIPALPSIINHVTILLLLGWLMTDSASLAVNPVPEKAERASNFALFSSSPVYVDNSQQISGRPRPILKRLVDYTVPVKAIREELERILKTTDLWDGKAWVLQITNATERMVELRALMSTPDAPTAWNLRCEVREKLIEFIQKNYPDGLPKVRAEILESVAPASAKIESKR